MENIENADILKAEIKSILAFKSKDGATFEDVRGKMKIEIKKNKNGETLNNRMIQTLPIDEYAYLMGKNLCFDSAKEFHIFLRTMPDVYAVKGSDRLLHWFSKSSKSKHIATMVEKQKPPREIPVRHHSPLRRKLIYNSTSTCYYNDNYMYKSSRLVMIGL